MTRRPRSPTTADVARLAQRLAVLLAAGVAPATAWRHAGGAEPAAWARGIAEAAAVDPAGIPAAIEAAAALVGGGHPAARRRRPGPEQGSPASHAAVLGLAAMWRVAAEAGAPLAPALRAAAAALRDAAAADRAARVALAGPRSTARLVVAMPVVAVGFGLLLGYDTLGVLVTTPVGWVCLAAGAGLLAGARAWTARLVGRAAVLDPLPGLELELLAVALGGGAPVPRARAIVAAAIGTPAAEPPDATADAVFAVAESVGAPVVELLRAEADEVRRDAAAAAAERAARLETSLMIPLGVCVLPAFVVLGVVPLLVAVLSSTVAIL